ncbi:unnamed protein product [Ixodes pacificus]
MLQEAGTSIGAAVADAVGRAVAGALPAVTRQAPSTREPPRGAFGSLNLGRSTAPKPDPQPVPGFSGASNPWPPLSAQEYEPSPAVQQAAAGIHERPAYQPRYDPRPLALRGTYQPYDIYEPNPAAHPGRQRPFTTTNPPSRRDIAEAFQHVQQAARHSTHIGKREVTELQYFELFVEV